MSSKKGFTLVEMLIVIILIGILVSVATLQFQQWIEVRNVEKQTREMYADLMDLRINSIQIKRISRAAFGPDRVQFRHSSIFNAYPSTTRLYRFPLRYMPAGGAQTAPNSSESTSTVRFDERGQTTLENWAIVVLPRNATAPHYQSGENCIIINNTITKIGRMENASSCRAR